MTDNKNDDKNTGIAATGTGSEGVNVGKGTAPAGAEGALTCAETPADCSIIL